MAFRGNAAVKFKESLRKNGKLMIRVPGGDHYLSVVSQYRHLGSVTTSDSSDIPYSKARASSAMSSYVPLAMKVFGSTEIGFGLKLTFKDSLIMSKLCFNSYVRCLSPQALKGLNSVYRRVVCRIAGEVYMDGSHYTDFEVRNSICLASIDCYIQRAWLKYIGMVIRRCPRTLFALLQACDDKGQPILPWTKLIACDLTRLYASVAATLDQLPDPANCPYVWYNFIRRWDRLVDQLHYVASACDRTVCSTRSSDSVTLPSKCEKCYAPKIAFPTLKTLNQHKRKMHGERNPIVYYAKQDGICPNCQTIIGSHLQLLAHLSDTGRPRCTNSVLQHCTRLSDKVVKDLDVADKAARAEAYKRGHWHAIVQVPAKSATGRVVGRTNAC